MPAPQNPAKSFAGIATAAVVGMTVAALYFAREVLVPLAMAGLLAFLLAPVATFLERRRLGRVTSVIFVTTVAFFAIVGVGYVVGHQIVALAEDLPNYQVEIARKGQSLKGSGHGFFAKFEKSAEAIQKAAIEPATQSTQPADGVLAPAAEQASDPAQAVARTQLNASPATAPSAIGSTPSNPIHTINHEEPTTPISTLTTYFGLVLGPLGTAGVVIVFVVFMLLEREALRDRMISVISRGRYTTATRALDDAARRISRYLVAQSIVNGGYGVMIGLGLWVIGMTMGHGVGFPSFVLWGVLCGILRFIPYIGPWIAAIFPAALALAVYPGFNVFIAVFVMFVVLELFSANVMEPWLYGASTGLSTMAILVAAVFWTWLWGPIGLLVSTPLTVCVVVLGKHVKQLKFLDTLLGDEPALPPAVSYYQRLLAGDVLDAGRVLENHGKDKDFSHQVDEVFVPALRMTRRDRLDEELSADDETRIFEQNRELSLPPIKTDAPALSPTAPLLLGIPAHHAADELTLHLLARALAPLGVRTEVLSTRLLPADVEKQVAEFKPAAVLISVLPPGGVVQARYLARRLRRQYPDLTIIVARWGKVREFDKLLVRLRNAGANYVVTSMQQAVGQIKSLIDPPDSPAPVPALAPARLPKVTP